MKLVHPISTGNIEIESNTYYRDVYEKSASGQKFTWNWSAFLFGNSWLLYRKMYLLGILFFVLDCIIFETIDMIPVNYGNILFTIFIFILLIIPHILLGLMGNWLYIKNIHKKIDFGYHQVSLKNVDGITWWIFFPFYLIFATSTLAAYLTFFFFTLISAWIHVSRDKRKVATALAMQNIELSINESDEKVDEIEKNV
jgi:hypothetical protein